ncbi:MAG TPA: hypothetical protein VFV08_08955, partial [Puia sp.]|nr:hypothetical protein [Puia sp.]
MCRLSMPLSDVSQMARISGLPIISGTFVPGPHPQNNFIVGQSSGGVSTQYVFHVANFDKCDRVALIINNVNTTTNFGYSYFAYAVYPPTPTPTPLPPC